MRRFVFVALCAISCHIAADEPSCKDAQSLAERVRLMRGRVHVALREEALWSTLHRSKELLHYLEFATRFPSKDNLPALLAHSTYRRHVGVSLGAGDNILPSLSAIVAVGPDAVPAIIERLKQIDWDVNEDADEEAQFLVYCLASIYGGDQGGLGDDEAVARLAAEIATAEGIHRTRLKCAVFDLIRFDIPGQ